MMTLCRASELADVPSYVLIPNEVGCTELYRLLEKVEGGRRL